MEKIEDLKLFHLSSAKGLTVLEKRIPKTLGEKEDDTIERVCFSTEIDGCFSAICPIFHKKLYLYTPLNPIPKKNLHKPTIKQVFDVKETKEIWALDNIPVKCIGIVMADDSQYEKRKNYITTFYKHTYKWHWIEKYE